MFTFFAHTGTYQIIQAPFGTVDGGAEIAAAHFCFCHRALVAVEFVGFEFHRRSFAVHGQVAVNGKQFFAVEIEFSGYKRISGYLSALKISADSSVG